MAVGAELGEPQEGRPRSKTLLAGKDLEATLRHEFRLLYRGREAIEPYEGLP
jgi:hypothetical protein